MDLVEEFDDGSLFMTLKSFVSVQGFPKNMFSDGGSHLIAANREQKYMITKWKSLEPWNSVQIKE